MSIPRRIEAKFQSATNIAIAFLLFFSTLLVYTSSKVYSGTDTIWSLYVASSILRQGNADLDEFSDLITDDDYRLARIGKHIYSVFPIGALILATPFVFAYDTLLNWTGGETFSDYLSQHAPDGAVFRFEKFIASFITASSVVILFFIAIRYTDLARAVIVALAFGLATSAWSTTSRGLWQHGPSMLAISIALYLITRSRDWPDLLPYAAIPLAFSFIIRPTNLIPLLVFSSYIFVLIRGRSIRYLICLLLILIPFFFYNHAIDGSVLPLYYKPSRLALTPAFGEALLGTIISPSRGLFVFSPILFACFYGVYLFIKQSDPPKIWPFIIVILILHWVSISMFEHWYGGWSIGPRLFTDVLPLFAFLLIPVVNHLPGLFPNWRPRSFVFWSLILISLCIQFRCSTSWAPFQWNNTPNNIDKNRFRLWDWADIQFLRDLCPDPYYQAPGCWQEVISQYTDTLRDKSQPLNQVLKFRLNMMGYLNQVFPCGYAMENGDLPRNTLPWFSALPELERSLVVVAG
jgi:hypothetical protein